MKIKVEHIINTFNYGSLMMAVNTLNYLKQNLEEVEFYVDSSTRDDLERLKKETKISDIKIAPKYDIVRNNIITKIIGSLKKSYIESRIYDVKIILGGDDISEYYIKEGWLILFPIMFINSIKLKTILLGQTIGPFTSYRKALARLALNKSKIYTRDDNCLKYIKSLGIKNAKKGRDLAFLELPIQTESNSILNKYELLKNQYITIVPSGLTRCYTSNNTVYINEQYNIIKRLMANERLMKKKIVLLAHVKDEGVADRIIIEQIEKKLTEEEKSRIILIKEDILASEARAILGNGLFTITGRMHAAVSTFYMRKPAVSLSYSAKYSGVIGDGLDMNELVIESADDKLWEDGEISRLVNEKVEYILNNYDDLFSKIDIKVSETSKIVEEQLEDLLNEIKKIQASKRK
ncbi:polysaccharide pyruvyl transferase family protein [Haloimpatiens lingqiaonensis]|uniref:polysaccharide pyruvyl transferase family protein n=1 Tax=Haloimpatiens lingqiaonensis TaxID=1380675 RepID=UPI0010FD5AA1|nr:polysaccharide pyruvyl transferase family protein [Haloimpatiens lingqiaonensis]